MCGCIFTLTLRLLGVSQVFGEEDVVPLPNSSFMKGCDKHLELCMFWYLFFYSYMDSLIDNNGFIMIYVDEVIVGDYVEICCVVLMFVIDVNIVPVSML